MQELQQYLKSRPDIVSVYFNEAGEYVFFPRPGFDQKMNRDEVLAQKVSKSEQVIADATAPVETVDAKVLEKLAEDVKSFEAEKAEHDIKKAELVDKELAIEDAQKVIDAQVAEYEAKKAELEKRAGDYDFADAEISRLKTSVATLTKELAATKKA